MVNISAEADTSQETPTSESGSSSPIVCPITNTESNFPLHVSLDGRTTTTGFIMCQHLKALDINARPYKFVESAPEDILENVINIIFSEIEIS